MAESRHDPGRFNHDLVDGALPDALHIAPIGAVPPVRCGHDVHLVFWVICALRSIRAERAFHDSLANPSTMSLGTFVLALFCWAASLPSFGTSMRSVVPFCRLRTDRNRSRRRGHRHGYGLSNAVRSEPAA